MNRPDEFDQVCNAIRNGHFRKGITIANTLERAQIVRMIDYFVYDLNDQELALEFVRAYFRYTD